MHGANTRANVPKLHWHVVYTRPRHEKKVHNALQKLAIESLLPTLKQRRQWSDRKKWIDVPLFPSYVFVHPALQQQEHVLLTPGVVRYVTFNGRKAIVQQNEMEFIQKVEKRETRIEVVADLFEEEEKVIITDGPFKGYAGRFLRSYADSRVAVCIEEIGYSVIIKATLNEIAPYRAQAGDGLS